MIDDGSTNNNSSSSTSEGRVQLDRSLTFFLFFLLLSFFFHWDVMDKKSNYIIIIIIIIFASFDVPLYPPISIHQLELTAVRVNGRFLLSFSCICRGKKWPLSPCRMFTFSFFSPSSDCETINLNERRWKEQWIDLLAHINVLLRPHFDSKSKSKLISSPVKRWDVISLSNKWWMTSERKRRLSNLLTESTSLTKHRESIFSPNKSLTE